MNAHQLPKRIGFVGGYGHHYLRGLLSDATKESKNIEIAWSGDGCDNQAAKSIAKNIDSAIWFDRLDEMIRKFQPEVLSVGGVYGINGDLVAQGLAAGLPVVCDKPIASTWQQFEKIVELAARNPACTLITEFPFRSAPAFLACRESILAGEIGPVVLMTAQKSYKFGTRPSWYADRHLYASTILWVASHMIDIIGYVTGRQIVRVQGRHGNVSQPDYGSMEDHCALICELDNGATAIIHADYAQPAQASKHGDDYLRIAGSKGVIQVKDGRCGVQTNREREQDTTNHVEKLEMKYELIQAIHKCGTDKYSTSASLDSAATLLACRDAADQKQIVDVQKIRQNYGLA